MKFNPNDTAFFENKEYHDDELLKSYENSTYAWDPSMKDKILRVSKSSLGTHGFCQYQYKLQYKRSGQASSWRGPHDDGDGRGGQRELGCNAASGGRMLWPR